MLFLWFLMGFFVGGFAGSLATALLGGFVGLTIGQVIRLRKDLDALQGHVASLEHQLRRQPTAPTESHRAPEASLVPPRAPKPDSDTKEGPIEIRPETAVPTEHLTQSPEGAGEFKATPPAASLRPTPAPRMGRHNPRPAKQAGLPRFLIRGLNALRQFITGGNTLARVGLLVLLVGVVLLLKYAVDNSLFPVEMRMASAAGLGMALVAVGFWQRTRRPDFALVLQGGGLATMYLVVFFSYQVYALIPGQAAFGMLVGLAGFGGVMAVKQNSMALILIGVVGGFLAPILASTGSNHHVALFSYYLILNVLIAGVAWFKVWRPLNLIGFLFTFGIGTLWGVLEYSSQNFASTEPFLIAFFLLYVAIVVLFAWRKQVQVRAWVDGTLTFGTPLAFLGLQYSMVHDMEFAMAYTTLGMAAIYVGVAAVLHRRAPEFMRNLIEAFLALGIGFATLAVPYGFDDQHSLTGATWSVEGLGLFWLGIRQKRNLSCFAGVLLQGFACVALLLSAFLGTYPADVPPFLNTPFIGWVLLCAGLLGIACMAYHDRARMKRSAPLLQGFVACAVLVWYGASFAEVLEHFGGKHETGALVLLVALTGLACEFGARRLNWVWGRLPAMLSIPWLLLLLTRYSPMEVAINPPALDLDYQRGVELALQQSPLAHGGWLAWTVFLAGMFVTVRRFARDHWSLGQWFLPPAIWVSSIFAGLLSAYHVRELDGLGGSWALVASAGGVMLVGALVDRHTRNESRPDWRKVCQRWGLGGVALLLALWQLRTNLLANGDGAPLPFAPLFNPLDVGLGLALCWGMLWAKRQEPKALIAAPPLVFLWINGMLARSVAHYAHVDWDPDALWDSDAMQVTVSVAWTLLGLGTVLWATRNRHRIVWFVGAALLAVVVGKLFLVDLEHLNTVIKIVTFLVVGVLLLVVGFFSPMPPADLESPDSNEELPEMEDSP